ncbi:MAG: chromosome partitioning protein ParA [Opitutaceae bacterium]|nr:chromosome partitioning protein ParA [Opitutaceae bacterium]
MKRGVIVGVLVLLLALAGIFAYKSHSARVAREKEAERIALAAQDAERARLEALRRAEADTEAKRLSELKARQDAAEAARLAEATRLEREAAEAARLAAEKSAARLAAEKEAARLAAEQAELEAQRLAALRDQETRDAEAKRLAALKALEDSESERKAFETRELARLEALRRQQELNALASAVARQQIDRIVFPEDYKRRRHYYMNVELMNAGLLTPPDESATKPAAKPAAPAAKK